MKVHELISKLKELPKDAEVRMYWHSEECDIRITTFDGKFYFEEGEKIDD